MPKQEPIKADVVETKNEQLGVKTKNKRVICRIEIAMINENKKENKTDIDCDYSIATGVNTKLLGDSIIELGKSIRGLTFAKGEVYDNGKS